MPTDLRPDIVWWDDKERSLCLAELTVCFESNFDEAALRKSAKYTELAEQAEKKGYSTILLTILYKWDHAESLITPASNV